MAYKILATVELEVADEAALKAMLTTCSLKYHKPRRGDDPEVGDVRRQPEYGMKYNL